MPLKRLAIALSVAAALSGCATNETVERLAFTDSVIRDYGLNDAHKRRLQYYTSGPIHLARSSSDSLRGIADGKLIDRGNTAVRSLDIPGETPGVLVGSGANWVAVSFSQGSWLYFVSGQSRVNSPYWNDERDPDRYYLYAPDWDGRAGTVRVGNIPYQAVEGSINTYLIVDREALYETDAQGGTLSGRWLDGRVRR